VPPVASDADRQHGPTIPALSIPDIRDYERVNAELKVRLDQGHRRVRLVGVEGQRLLVAGLAGAWEAVVEVEGRAGPELAAGLNAPRMTVVCRGPAADGAGRGLQAGLLVIQGDAGPAVGYAQRGGWIVVAGDAGPRAGLNQSGGALLLLGRVGPLAGERQSGGTVYAVPDRLGPHAGRGQRGGTFVGLSSPGEPAAGLDQAAADLLRSIRSQAEPWLAPRTDRSIPPDSLVSGGAGDWT
jgi:glutamate synthase domain-containing protein 3